MCVLYVGVKLTFVQSKPRKIWGNKMDVNEAS